MIILSIIVKAFSLDSWFFGCWSDVMQSKTTRLYFVCKRKCASSSTERWFSAGEKGRFFLLLNPRSDDNKESLRIFFWDVSVQINNLENKTCRTWAKYHFLLLLVNNYVDEVFLLDTGGRIGIDKSTYLFMFFQIQIIDYLLPIIYQEVIKCVAVC